MKRGHRRERVLVIGAGLSGLSAADTLLDAGFEVTVVDAFPVPGGRASSFELPAAVAGLQPGDVVEHGLHAWFQHYHALFRLMARYGADKPGFVGRGIHFWHAATGHFHVSGGPGTWLVNALRLPEAVRGERSAALRAFGRLISRLGPALADPERTDRESALSFMRAAGLPQPAIDHIFAPCLYSLTSLRLSELSALTMMHWMSNILPDPRIRCLQGGSTQQMCEPIARGLQARGMDLRLGVEVLRLSLTDTGRCRLELRQAPDRTGVRHLLVPGFAPAEPPDPDRFDAVVCTLPWERLVAVSDPSVARFAPELADNLRALRNIHPLTARLWFERPIEGAEDAYVLCGGTVFDVLRPTPEPERQPGIHLIDLLIENIERELPEVGYDEERLWPTDGPAGGPVLRRLLHDLERLYPGQIRDNPLRRAFVHSREGIVACHPGSWARRPGSFVGSRHFVLAGDYTRQPYGVCMEGAVRSGQIAVRCLLAGREQSPSPRPFAQLGYSVVSVFQR